MITITLPAWLVYLFVGIYILDTGLKWYGNHLKSLYEKEVEQAKSKNIGFRDRLEKALENQTELNNKK